MIADAISYLILIGGLAGITLGLYGLARPHLATLRGMLPSLQRHERDMLLVEEALAEIDYEALDHEVETFRSFFTAEETERRRERGERTPREAPRGAAPSTPPAVRTVRAFSEHDPSAPRVAELLQPLKGELPPLQDEAVTAVLEEEDPLLAELLEEEENALGGVDLEDEQEAPAAEGLDDDLLSLFAETEELHAVPEAILRAIPAVSISDLLAEARALQGLMNSGGKAGDAAA